MQQIFRVQVLFFYLNYPRSTWKHRGGIYVLCLANSMWAWFWFVSDYKLVCVVQKASWIVFAILRTRSSPSLHPGYHILYNYHVYWIFIFTVTKEPSAYSSSPVKLLHQLRNILGMDQSSLTPPIKLQLSMSYSSQVMQPLYIFLLFCSQVNFIFKIFTTVCVFSGLWFLEPQKTLNIQIKL